MNKTNTSKVPVLLLAFNRPVITQRVLDMIAWYQPPVLYVGVDGPRKNNANDNAQTTAVHELISNWQAVNPGTSVKTLYQPHNLGCGKAVSTAISWFFKEEEMGIILEDDCLPNQSFFSFCETLLHHYKTDVRIMHIGGSNFLEPAMQPTGETYYFSVYPQIWGWASWRRAWQQYDFDMTRLDELIKMPEFKQFFSDELFLATKNKQLDTWDVQWVYTVAINKGLSILPYLCMVTNLGYNEHGGSHLSKMPSWYTDKVYELGSISINEEVKQDTALDKYVFNRIYKRGFVYRLKKRIKKMLFTRK